MKYDYGLKHISKMTGLTGVEAKNIAQQLKHKGIDYQVFDWKTIGEDLYGYGKRSSAVKQKLSSMYGISLETHSNIKDERDKYNDMEIAGLMPALIRRNDRRRKIARRTDYSKGAKNTFKPTNKAGVAKWMKHPNRYDIIGVDDLTG